MTNKDYQNTGNAAAGTASTTSTTAGTGTGEFQRNYYPYTQKSAICPYCTPRCPHGYPVETQPAHPFPWIVYC